MFTELTFSMDGRSSAPHRVGSYSLPQANQYFTRWVDRGSRTYLTLMVRSSIADLMVAKVCRMHPSVRCISRTEMVASTPSLESAAS